MRMRSRIALCALTTTLVLAAAVSGAGARRIELSNQRFRIIWNPLQFSNTGIGFSTGCPVTLEGSFHSKTLSKVSGNLVGYVTRTYIQHPSCSPRFVNFLSGAPEAEPSTLPWHVRYDSFSGTLPSITQLDFQIINFEVDIELNGTTCLFGSTPARPFFLLVTIGAGGILEKAIPTNAMIPRNGSNALLCPTEIEISGRGNITLLGNENAITVRLVA